MNLMVTTNQKYEIDRNMGGESKHNSKDHHHMTSKESKRRKKKQQNHIKCKWTKYCDQKTQHS